MNERAKITASHLSRKAIVYLRQSSAAQVGNNRESTDRQHANAKSGVCFPSYEKIAEAAGCARSTVSEAIKALEAAGILTWVHRLKRVRRPMQIAVERTSNAYSFRDPGSNSDLATRTIRRSWTVRLKL
jgi:biotin operon repressor